jgi:hypothetical protein
MYIYIYKAVSVFTVNYRNFLTGFDRIGMGYRITLTRSDALYLG